MNEFMLIPIIAASLAALLLLVSYICYKLTFGKQRRGCDDPHRKVTLAAYSNYKHITEPLINEISKTPCEYISISSYDGITLRGRYYHLTDGAPIEIQMHGYKSHPLRDFCGGARDARARGHNLILIDQRAHGRSDGSSISFGIKERFDCLSWISYAIDRFGEDCRILLLGMSMGAATVLMASGLPLPKNVVGVMADCPYSSPREIIRKVIREDMGLPVSILYPFVRLGGRIFGGFDIEAASPLEAVRNSELPTLIIHGSADSFVPEKMSELIFDSCGARLKRRLLIEGADHGLSYLCDKTSYLAAVDEFMSSVLSENCSSTARE